MGTIDDAPYRDDGDGERDDEGDGDDGDNGAKSNAASNDPGEDGRYDSSRKNGGGCTVAR